jgi:hypothetical protein
MLPPFRGSGSTWSLGRLAGPVFVAFLLLLCINLKFPLGAYSVG